MCYIKLTLVAAKSRVVPMSKKLTVPRVELLGNLIISRLVCSVLRAITTEFFISKIFCWTDSQITLAWIKSITKEFKPFIENRAIEVRKNVSASNWYYVPSGNNPADLITRSNNDISSDIWFNGPTFLYNQNSLQFDEDFNDAMKDPQYVEEIRNNNVVLTVMKENNCLIGNVIDISKFNDYLKLLRVTGYVLRYVSNLRRKRNNEALVKSKYLSAAEINDAKRAWIKDNQSNLVGEKYNELKLNLNLQRGEDGLIRSYSRLRNASVPFDAKTPIFIDKDHKLATMLVCYYHLRVMHRGVKQTLTEFRSMFWCTQGRSFVKKVIHPCVVCKKLNSRPYEYPNHSDMPDLRFDDAYPFSSTGLDYLGAIYCLPVYGQDERMRKAYIVIYTCTATRAVILDVVSNANTDNFLNSFKRFLSRRGCPATMISDNAGIFTCNETQAFASDRGINWKFNLDCAPWFGGIWERLVASVKRCIKKVVGTKRLSYVELQTLVYEIELILNNRPIGCDYDDDHEDVITPNHLVFGRRIEPTNVFDVAIEKNPDGSNSKLVKRQRMIGTLLSHFWTRWRKEYVTGLREYQRTKRQKHSAMIKIGDVVIIFEEKQPRHLWKVGRVLSIIPGRDGRIRGAEVKVGKSRAVIKRPVNRLYPLVQV